MKVAKQGFVKAYVWLGVMYIDGVGVAKDEASAMKWFMKAAEQGNDSSAQFNAGIMYMNVIVPCFNGVAKDDASAVKWFLKAAEQGHAKAQFKVAVFYDKGVGVAKDRTWAVHWYVKAASQCPGADGVI